MGQVWARMLCVHLRGLPAFSEHPQCLAPNTLIYQLFLKPVSPHICYKLLKDRKKFPILFISPSGQQGPTYDRLDISCHLSPWSDKSDLVFEV